MLKKRKMMDQVRVIHSDGLNHSNMQNISNHINKKVTTDAYLKAHAQPKIIKVYDGGNSFIDEIEED